MTSLNQKTTKLGYRNAYHLLRRCSYKINKAAIDEYALKTPVQALNELFTYSEPILYPRPLTLEGKTYIKTNRYPTAEIENYRLKHGVSRWWQFNSLQETNLKFRLEFLLHTFFITNRLGADYWNKYDYQDLLSYYSKGSIKSLAQDVIKNYNMLFYLDNNINSVQSPNDNFGREFMELFTIGKGPQIATGNYTNYTEHDVTQAQRIFTGITSGSTSLLRTKRIRFDHIDPVTKIPGGYIIADRHDTGDKTFSAAFGNQVIKGGTTVSEIQTELNEFINMLFEQTATAKNYVRRFYRYFVGREITAEIERDLITPLAQNLKNNNYEIAPMLTQLLTSKHFYNEEEASVSNATIGSLIKSPFELFTQTLTLLEVPLPDYTTSTFAAHRFVNLKIEALTSNTGLKPFEPESVNGYPGYSEVPYDKNFITTNSLKLRYDLIIDDLLKGYVIRGFKFHLNSVLFVKNAGHFSDPSDSTKLLESFFDLLFVERPTGDRYGYFEQALLNGLSATNWYFVWKNYLSSNDPSDAVLYLNRLISALVKSPEYQIM